MCNPISCTVEPLYCGQHWDKFKYPDYRGVLVSGVNLYYKAQFGTFLSVLNTGVSSIKGFHCTTMGLRFMVYGNLILILNLISFSIIY